MDYTIRKRKIQRITTDNIYNHDISMYTDIPQINVSLSEFEELALERLQLLRIIEQASLKGYKLFSDEWKSVITEDLIKNGLKRYRRLLNGSTNSQNELDIQARRADHLSHYILRLAYCRSENLRRWFISREIEWFKLRFIIQTPDSIRKFLQVNNFAYTPISEEEKIEYKNDLIICIPGLTDSLYEMNDFYKVPFFEVVPLVKSRKICLNYGYAYIPMSDLVVCIQSKFRAGLSEALNVYNHRLPSVDDDRLNDLLCNLHNLYTGNCYSIENDNKDRVDPASIDKLAKQHFPLCMQYIHGILKTNHHLKHGCRLHFGLFLKGIGLLYEDAMDFWRQEFTKSMDINKFEKQYAYGIRYNYGKSGKMVDFSPYSCYKIIMENVGPGEHHGCPFKHWDATLLKQRLVERGFSSDGIDSIMELVKDGHYQISCTKYFECCHGAPPSNTISHPNQYYTDSVTLSKMKQQKKI